MQKVEMFQSDSGEVFKTQDEAVAADIVHRFKKVLEDNPLWGNYQGSRVDDAKLLLQWIADQKEMVQKFVNLSPEHMTKVLK